MLLLLQVNVSIIHHCSTVSTLAQVFMNKFQKTRQKQTLIEPHSCVFAGNVNVTQIRMIRKDEQYKMNQIKATVPATRKLYVYPGVISYVKC